MATTSSESKIITGYLKRIIGSPVGESIPLTDGDIIIGRARTSGICVFDPNISRLHCTLQYTDNGWSITDLGGCNGTFLDGKKLPPHVAQPLTDGLGIYLGPPKEAPAAFIFLKSMGVAEVPGTDQTDLPLRNNSGPVNQTLDELNQKDHLTLKRRAIPGPSDASHSVSPTKKTAFVASSCFPVNNTPGVDSQTTVGQVSDGDVSDCSISSTDSLRTRVRKINSAKKKKKSDCLIKIGDQNVASTSASSLRTNLFNQNGFVSIPSTSAAHTGSLPHKMSRTAEKCTTLKVEKPNIFKELDQLLSEESDQGAASGEDSESLLNDSMLLADCEAYPFSQPLPTLSSISVNQEQSSTSASHSNSVKEGQHNMQDDKALHEDLKKTNSKLVQENSTQRQKLNELLKEMKAKENPTALLGNMLEEELICNICTEIFIKATTLGCSHTYCEYCIKTWKKKQKRCPICREVITSETRVLILDNFIDKVVDQFDEEYKNKRKELISSREETQNKEKLKPKRRKGPRSRSRRGNRRAGPARLPSLRLDELLAGVPYPIIDLEDTSALSDESDSDPSEDPVFFGGYGRCFSCGRANHWANACPYR